MTVWQGAWHIAKHELLRSRYGTLITLVFTLYLVFTTWGLFDSELETPRGVGAILDFLFLSLFPVLAFSFNRTTFRYWREDSASRTMAQWRTLPIPAGCIVLGRYMQLVITLAPMMAVYFTIQYFLIPGMSETIGAGTYLLFALFWFFYSLGMAAIYLYFELSLPGKAYTVVCFIATFLFLLIATAFALAKAKFVIGVLEALSRGEWWYAVASAIFCIASLFVGFKAIRGKLQTRNFTV